MKRLREKLDWGLLLILLFLALALGVVWGLPFLPLQDYAQNLFQAQLTGRLLSGHGVESAVYQVQLKPTYSAFYVAVWLFGGVMPLEAAGRAAVSLYLLLVGVLALRLRRLGGTRGIAGALLLFPAAFNQMYLLGFFHYLYATPVLVIALLQLQEDGQRPWTWRPLVIHVAMLLLLLFLHPFALVLYAVVAGVWLVPGWNGGVRRSRMSTALGAAVALAGAWVVSGWIVRAGATDLTGIGFESPVKNLEFLVYLFTGMRGPAAPDAPTLVLWLMMIGALIYGAIRARSRHPLVRPISAAIAVLVLMTLFSPFSTANSSYLNVRIVVPIYFLLATLVALVPLKLPSRMVLASLSALLLANTWRLQMAMARETAEIVPIVNAMEPGAMVLPLIFDRESPACDGYYFSPHLNDHFYYHLAKGGASPYLLEAPRNGRAPVSFMPGARPPAPDEYVPTDFRWEKYGAPYRYFLVRGGSPSLYRYMEQESVLRVISGKWRLYERR